MQESIHAKTDFVNNCLQRKTTFLSTQSPGFCFSACVFTSIIHFSINRLSQSPEDNIKLHLVTNSLRISC